MYLLYSSDARAPLAINALACPGPGLLSGPRRRRSGASEFRSAPRILLLLHLCPLARFLQNHEIRRLESMFEHPGRHNPGLSTDLHYFAANKEFLAIDRCNLNIYFRMIHVAVQAFRDIFRQLFRRLAGGLNRDSPRPARKGQARARRARTAHLPVR